MAGRHPGIPTGVHVLLERPDDGRVLLMRRAGTGFFDGLWSLPGGHVEDGESLRAAACREIAEELAVALAPDALDVIGVVHRRSDSSRIDFFVRARAWHGAPRINEPDKCDALEWCRRDALPAEIVGYVRDALLDPAREPWIHESGWD